ncbi:MAG: dynamin family protein [Roseobacter sp.]
MRDESVFSFLTKSPGPRLPRIALMGEFSAGKSTLANLMIGTNPLPVQVVATQLPPVWISHGRQEAMIVDLDGHETPCDLHALQGIVPEDVAFIRFYCEEEILRRCDIIDMPGISDPNMSSTVWERMMPLADGVLWCSPATQAWRQSEAAVWNEIDECVQDNSLLVLTRADMLTRDKDKQKVLNRVKGEAERTFAKVLMISLTLARDAGEDADLWKRSGADEFVSGFLALVERISRGLKEESLSDVKPEPVSELDALEPEQDSFSRRSSQPRRPEIGLQREGNMAAKSTTEPDPMSYMPKFS